jgi:hypothetical protein
MTKRQEIAELEEFIMHGPGADCSQCDEARKRLDWLRAQVGSEIPKAHQAKSCGALAR